jgi:hypothetical protein
MGHFRVRVTALGLISVIALLVAAPLAAQQQATDTPLPVQRVVLYKSGIGYFEHLGQVSGDRDVTISFTSAQLDDVLKTLTVLDLDGGRVTDIGYNSLAPLDQRLRNVRLPVGETPTLFELLSALRGTRVEVRTGTAAVAGRVLSAERHERVVGDTVRATEEVSIVTDAGEVRRFEFGPEVSVRLLDEDLRQEMTRYLTLLESTREEDVRRLTISTQGSGERDLFVSYVSEVPIWKSSYRIVMPAEPGGAAILQGWAIVDNTVGEDWEDVELSLVGGAPQSFIQQISQPYYARRPVVPLPEYAQSTPQTHGATLGEGSGRVFGEVRDADGAALPGVRVTAVGAGGEVVARAISRASGEYALGPLPASTYRIRFELNGFATQEASQGLSGGQQVRRNVRLLLSRVEETLSVTAQSPVMAGGGAAGARAAGVPASQPEPLPEAPEAMAWERVAEALESQQAAAGGQQLGDLFEYRITDPVTIRRNQSALVPILREEVSVEKVSLWRGTGAGRPLRTLWLTNASGLSLDGGSFTVLQDGAFAGEGLLDSMEPGERRLLSYGTDVAMLVEGAIEAERGAVTRVTAQRGVLVYERDRRERRTYTIRNEDAEQRTIIVEHPNRPGWEIISEALPEETAPGAYRFRVAVDPQQTATLTVAESQPIATRVALTDITDDHVAMLIEQGVSRPALEQALRPILDKKAEIAAVQRENQSRAAELTRIERDQARVRENIQALGSSPEERALISRYVQQLDQQEDRLEELRREMAERSERLEALQLELQELIETTSIGIDAQA